MGSVLPSCAVLFLDLVTVCQRCGELSRLWLLSPRDRGSGKPGEGGQVWYALSAGSLRFDFIFPPGSGAVHLGGAVGRGLGSLSVQRCSVLRALPEGSRLVWVAWGTQETFVWSKRPHC